MCLVGAWHVHKSADQEVLRTLADCEEYEDVERHVADLQQIEDCPVWSLGQHRGGTSKVDVLFAVAPLMTEQNINDFFTLAEYVLSESDPALELPETERWTAAVRGKVRDHSAALLIACLTLRQKMSRRPFRALSTPQHERNAV